MKHLKRWMCLLGAMMLLTLTACGGTKVTESQQVSPTPTQEVTETTQPSQSPAVSLSPSDQPQQTKKPTQGQDKAESSTSAPAATAQPTQKPTQTSQPAQKPVSTPKPSQKPAATPQPTQTVHTCYLSIECKTILNRMEDLTPGKESLVPADGVILARTAVTFEEGESVFDVLLRATQSHGIHMEYSYTPGFGSHYIEGIHNLYEFDCGAGSGWMYYVNGVKPNYGVSKYTVKDGDEIQFRYTCDLGFDL